MRGFNKYGAKKSGGYDSQKEHSRANQLKLMEERGIISNLQFQVKYELIPKQTKQVEVKLKTKTKIVEKVIEQSCSYIADFVYNRDGITIVEDSKGMRLPEYIIKRKLMLHIYGIEILET